MSELLTTEIRSEQFHSTPFIEFGDVAAGRFGIIDLLSTSNVGKVFGGVDIEDEGKEIAFKVPNLDRWDGYVSQVILDRFVREIEYTQKLSEENQYTIPYVDAGISESQGMPYLFLATEKMPGITLEEKRKKSQAGRVALDEFVEITTPALVGLSIMHDKDLVHGDVKPDNIFIDKDNHGKIGDLGMVCEADDPDIAKEKSSSSLIREDATSPFVRVGTKGYQAPESRIHKVFTPASDIFSFGRLMRVALTGESALSMEDPDGVTRIIQKEDGGIELILLSKDDSVRDNFKNISKPVGELALACNEKMPENRPTTTEVISELKAA